MPTRPPTLTRSLATASVFALALLLPGCGTEPVAPPRPPLPPAAEPANAPVPARPPAGRVVPVGPIAEGVVADPVTGLVAVGLRDPFRLALVDGRTGEIRRQVPLPGHLRHLQLVAPGGPVLVPAESANTVLQVSLPAGTVISQVKVGNVPHDATATPAGTLAVGNEFGGTVSVVDHGRVVHTFDDATQPGGLAAVGERVAMVDVRENTLTVYDLPRRERVAELPAGRGPTHAIAVGRGRVLVADTRGDGILLFGLDPRPGQLARLPLPGKPYGLAFDKTRNLVWVTLTATNEVVGIDVGGQAPRVVTRLPTIRQPNTVAVDSTTGRLFVASPTEGALQLIDPATP